jgi:hypothetical protein
VYNTHTMNTPMSPYTAALHAKWMAELRSKVPADFGQHHIDNLATCNLQQLAAVLAAIDFAVCVEAEKRYTTPGPEIA